MLKLLVRLTFALQGASASWKILITAMALISIRFPNSGIKEYINLCMMPFSSILPHFLQEKNIIEKSYTVKILHWLLPSFVEEQIPLKYASSS